MKFPTKAQEAAHQSATVQGATKGFLTGVAFTLPASYILNKRWPYYRSLPPSLKALGIVTVVVPSTVIAAERAGLRYERTQWHDVGKAELDSVQSREQVRWNSLTTGQRIAEFAAHHPYGAIASTWAAGMIGAYSWISRDPHQTFLQKVTQTRVWAQGLTLGVILAAAALTHSSRSKRDLHESDHSWRDVIEETERREREKR